MAKNILFYYASKLILYTTISSSFKIQAPRSNFNPQTPDPTASSVTVRPPTRQARAY
ncbi:hypothetical protein ANN_09900 [Periplaneta americana]|uniref:Uncharacterized protein n=1 Tax=Periplaneta americana TaxID=6978 RepID=A0ABQ8TP29_PERAM|nr:hypothetical protein ANN_09900 [Periplaneta americana]